MEYQHTLNIYKSQKDMDTALKFPRMKSRLLKAFVLHACSVVIVRADKPIIHTSHAIIQLLNNNCTTQSKCKRRKNTMPDYQWYGIYRCTQCTEGYDALEPNENQGSACPKCGAQNMPFLKVSACAQWLLLDSGKKGPNSTEFKTSAVAL